MLFFEYFINEKENKYKNIISSYINNSINIKNINIDENKIKEIIKGICIEIQKIKKQKKKFKSMYSNICADKNKSILIVNLDNINYLFTYYVKPSTIEYYNNLLISQNISEIFTFKLFLKSNNYIVQEIKFIKEFDYLKIKEKLKNIIKSSLKLNKKIEFLNQNKIIKLENITLEKIYDSLINNLNKAIKQNLINEKLGTIIKNDINDKIFIIKKLDFNIESVIKNNHKWNKIFIDEDDNILFIDFENYAIGNFIFDVTDIITSFICSSSEIKQIINLLNNLHIKNELYITKNGDEIKKVITENDIYPYIIISAYKQMLHFILNIDNKNTKSNNKNDNIEIDTIETIDQIYSFIENIGFNKNIETLHHLNLISTNKYIEIMIKYIGIINSYLIK